MRSCSSEINVQSAVADTSSIFANTTHLCYDLEVRMDLSRRSIYRYKKGYRGYFLVFSTLLITLILLPSKESGVMLLHSKPTLSMLATSVARKQGIDPNLVKAVINVESSWRPSARSSKGAIGLMQVHHPTWGHLWTKEELLNPEMNIVAGTRILKDYIKQSRTLDEALHKYSGGASGYADKVRRRMKG